jgi:hypothetical protein
MSTVQEMLLGLLRNPLFKFFLLSPTLRYLIKKLDVDLVSPFLRGSTGRDVLVEVGKKIRDQWKLVTFARIRFYRGLAHDDLITEKQLQRLERNAEVVRDVLLGAIDTERPAMAANDADSSQNVLIMTENSVSNDIRVLATIMYRKPVPFPWERDTDFFEKHPMHKLALQNIQQKERETAWYDLLWNAMVDGLRY